MITVAILATLVLLLVATPWRRLGPGGRVWALAASLNALAFFSMPTTAATSPWRPVVGRVLATSAGVSLVLLLVGFSLRRRHVVPSDSEAAWLAVLILGALPCLFYAFFWVIGPLY